jgi:hypothetical protein
MHGRVALGLVLALGASCAPAKPAPRSSPRAAARPEPETEPENVGLFDVELVEAKANEVLAVVEQASKKKVVVDAGALHALSCATASVHLRRVNPSILIDQVAVALRPKGFLFQRTGEGFVVKLDPNVPEPRCPNDPDPSRLAREREDASIDLDALRAEIRKGQGAVTPTERTITRRARDLLRRHAARIFEQVRLEPEVEGGKIIGLRVVTERGEPLLVGLGLRAGDVVKAVNDKSITDPNAVLGAYEALREADAVTVLVLRKGKNERVTIRTID